ncbi:MAG TPA: 3' terminal RNA ribose 2'-O-methyltransferase Hen1 [Candidatus Polarisedimenticolia bacterium]|jgi:3' terminal RNA ribose 2'-O-methyltransferase Hen1
MLLTITNEKPPATDLGYLLHKKPARVQRFSLAFGAATVFYPEASDNRCSAVLLLDVDPVGLVRPKGGETAFALEQYVNDRPYAASSFLSVAIARVYGSALKGQCSDRPELVEQPLPLTAELSAVPARGGVGVLRRLFEPLGYRVESDRHVLDSKFPDWGESPYHAIRIAADVKLRDLLSHLYVLIPVLDDDKHYWVGEDEVEKLLKRGEGWLVGHPERALIAERYLKHRRSLVDAALTRLLDEDQPGADEIRTVRDEEEEVIEKPLRLNDLRLDTVHQALSHVGAKRVLDLGCGEGKLLRHLLKDRTFDEIVGVDVSHRALEIAHQRLHLERLPERDTKRIRLLHGALTYRDRRLEGYDAAALVEVIEHLDAPRLRALERTVFECAKPETVVLTTPNREFNTKFETLPEGRFRHRDHRFEWTRGEFRAWAEDIAARFGYAVEFAPVGPEDAELGPPTQMAVFRR